MLTALQKRFPANLISPPYGGLITPMHSVKNQSKLSRIKLDDCCMYVTRKADCGRNSSIGYFNLSG